MLRRPHVRYSVRACGFQYPLFRIVDCFDWLRVGMALHSLFQYPLFRIVDCFCHFCDYHEGSRRVSISALSDRGLLLYPAVRSLCWIVAFQYPLFRIVDCFTALVAITRKRKAGFNIRSFGSWIASRRGSADRPGVVAVSISALSDRGLLPMPAPPSPSSTCVSISALSDRGLLHWFYYVKLVDGEVSISALSDRGLLLRYGCQMPTSSCRFNIRSFGSWIASSEELAAAIVMIEFQYPLFRIVDCFDGLHRVVAAHRAVSISALSDRGLLQSQFLG